MIDNLVIIPTYNEAGNINRVLDRVFSLDTEFHVLVVDDGSPDGTSDLVKARSEDFNQRLFILERSGKLGLGTAYIAGFKWALEHHYQFIIEMDADLSHNPDDLPRLLECCASSDKYGMSIGSRYTKGGGVENWSWKRVMLSYFASVYVQMVTFLPVRDTTAGFVCYRREALEKLNFDGIRFVGYAFQIEMKYAIWNAGYKLKEVPIVFKDRTIGESKMSINIFNEAFYGVIKMRFSSKSRYYK